MFDQWTAKEAADSIPDKSAAWLTANMFFADGDHWQNGAAWIGPMLTDGSQGYTTMLANVERTFVPQNAIGEIVDRHVAGVVGESPQKHIELKRPLAFAANADDAEPTADETALLAEAGALLSSWWGSAQGVVTRNGRISRTSPHEVFQEAARAMLLTRRGPLRFIVPARLLSVDEDGRTAVQTAGDNPIADVLAKIHIQHASPKQATVATDPDTMDQAGVYTYQTDAGLAAAEICFVDENGRTVVRVIEGDNAADYPLPLDGRLTMHEMERPLFIDEPKRRLQKSLNLARTSESRNIVDGGFLERLYLNTQMPGEWVDDSTVAGGRRFEAAAINLGPNTANFLTGTPIYDENGQVKGYATPSAVFREPTPADVFVDTAADIYTALLHEASQLHVLAQSGDGQASGEFVVQARADFETSLKQSKAALDSGLTWCFDTVLALAAAIAGQPGHFDALKISGSSIINSGPLSIGERTAIISAYDKDLISRETAVRMLGAENVSAELERIEGEMGHKLGLLRKQAEILELLGRAAVALPAAVQTVQDGEIGPVTIRGDFVPEGN